MPWKRRKECKEGRVSLIEKEENRKMFGESLWKLKMRLTAAESWTNRRKSCRRSYEMSTDRRLFPKRCRIIMESSQHQLQEVQKRRHDLMREHQKVQKRSQKIQASRTRGKYAGRKCCSVRRVAEVT